MQNLTDKNPKCVFESVYGSPKRLIGECPVFYQVADFYQKA